MKHHSLHSGYDRLSDYIQCEIFDSGYVSKGMGLIPDRLWGLLLRRSKFYLVPEMKREINLQVRALFYSKSIFHFLYGENDFRIFRPQKKHKLFVTYHFPPEKYCQYFAKPPNLERANAIIVVGSNQVDYFAKWFLREKILFIPHGVDTQYYMPAENEIRGYKILFVGTHLRDFDILKGVIERIEKLSINLSFTIVTFKENWKIFQGLKKIELVDGVTEAKLLQLYQNHALLFLPLIDGTANNTLLEAASSGLPIITTDIGGVRDYLDDETVIFLRSREIDTVVSTIMDLLNDVRKRKELATKARQKMLSYDWKFIAETMEKVYEVY
jgi:glycosyltransferase involved in cell wall biosynthesis